MHLAVPKHDVLVKVLNNLINVFIGKMNAYNNSTETSAMISRFTIFSKTYT